jgi:hypothetical protein
MSRPEGLVGLGHSDLIVTFEIFHEAIDLKGPAKLVDHEVWQLISQVKIKKRLTDAVGDIVEIEVSPYREIDRI